VSEPLIRAATSSDAAAVAAIYTHHVLTGVASFDFDPRPTEHFAARIAEAQDRGWPFLVAQRSAELAGYAYAAPFRDRPGYRFACENSIYVHPAQLGRGIGRALLAELIEAAEQAGFRQMIAVVSSPEPASVALHRAAGFREAGRLQSVGRKHGRWLDTRYLQRALGGGDRTEPEHPEGDSSART
jgi:phosphinothricin acetyltransferase